MNLTNLLGLLLLLLFIMLMISYALIERYKPFLSFRDIPAFIKLKHAFALSVEAGKRIHICLGHGDITSERANSGLIGLSVLNKIINNSSMSDRPPIATSGDASLAILSQGIMKAGYSNIGAQNQYNPQLSRLAGITPFSFAAGCLPIIFDEHISMDILLGHFDSEAGLILDASQRVGNISLAGSDHLNGQAVMYVSACEPLIGEELFAAGAYIQANRMHTASLFTQDIVRWILVFIIVIGSILKAIGII